MRPGAVDEPYRFADLKAVSLFTIDILLFATRTVEFVLRFESRFSGVARRLVSRGDPLQILAAVCRGLPPNRRCQLDSLRPAELQLPLGSGCKGSTPTVENRTRPSGLT